MERSLELQFHISFCLTSLRRSRRMLFIAILTMSVQLILQIKLFLQELQNQHIFKPIQCFHIKNENFWTYRKNSFWEETKWSRLLDLGLFTVAEMIESQLEEMFWIDVRQWSYTVPAQLICPLTVFTFIYTMTTQHVSGRL